MEMLCGYKDGPISVLADTYAVLHLPALKAMHYLVLRQLKTNFLGLAAHLPLGPGTTCTCQPQGKGVQSCSNPSAIAVLARVLQSWLLM